MLAVTRTQSSGLVGERHTGHYHVMCSGQRWRPLQSWGGEKGVGGTATVTWANGPEETLREGTVHAWGRRTSYS